MTRSLEEASALGVEDRVHEDLGPVALALTLEDPGEEKQLQGGDERALFDRATLCYHVRRALKLPLECHQDMLPNALAPGAVRRHS